MSHLDNNENKKEFWTKKKVVIFLIIFTIICAGITSGLIYVENSTTKETVEGKKETIIPDGFGVKSLNDKYKFNSLEIEEIKYTEGTEIVDEWGYSKFSKEVEYIKIKGLKNKEIENSINEEIKNVSIELAQKEYGYDYNRVTATIWANFSNVLSINIHRYSYDEEYNEEKNENISEDIYLNYNLTTGEKLKFKDIFTNDANLKNIISQSAYKSLAWKYLGTDEDDPLWGDMDKIENPNIEEQVAELIYEFESQDDFEFCFTSEYAYVNIADKTIKIELAYFYNQIAIYNRFSKNENIFENDDSKECMVFFDRQWSYLSDFWLEEVSDRLFINAINHNINDKIAKLIKNEIQYKITDYQKYLKNNPDKAIILGMCIENYDEENDNKANITLIKHTMSKDFYENDAKYKMIYYSEGGDSVSMVSIYDESIENDYTHETRIYDLQNNTYKIEEYKSSYDSVTGNYQSFIEKIDTYDALTGKLIKTENINTFE